MANESKWLYLSIISSLLLASGLVHQKLFTMAGWFNWGQFWHHEPLIAMAFVAWITLLFVYLVEGRWGKGSRNRLKKGSD